MRKIHTEVLVIGGGATGTGILRDLALRGFNAILVEARDLTHGTTGRFHGLLHSGGRYAVKDPQAAQECIKENWILRKIMPHCIEDVGGFFVVTPWDEPGYTDSFLAGCQSAGIPVEEVPIEQMLKEEPLLNPEISRCFRVPDGSADSFAAAHANAASAREYGASALTYHEVTRLLTEDRRPKSNSPRHPSSVTRHVIGALCHDLVNDEQVKIHADIVVNAAGAWVGKIGATIGVEIAIRPGKGTMIAVSQRVVNTVINRCKVPSDGDILVPAHTVAVMGTTDQQVPDPDSFAIEPWEVQLMLNEGEKIIPGFKEMRMLRAWAGVRPLYQEKPQGSHQSDPNRKSLSKPLGSISRDITRSFVLLDHEGRDGVSGFVTITGGKWTTYRKMAEVTVDLVCEKLDTQRDCGTHLEELPTDDGRQTSGFPHHLSSASRHHVLGERLANIEQAQAYGDLVCECELVTRQAVEAAIHSGEAHTLDDLRRDLRLGMGPCQGGFCSLRAAGIWHQLSNIQSSISSITALRDFLEERWKGLLPVLWGKQLHQERLNELIYVNVLNIDHLPGPRASRLAARPYEQGSRGARREQGSTGAGEQHPRTPAPQHPTPHSPWHSVVIGAGLSGLTAAWQASKTGLRTKVIAKGWGATHWGSGCIDVLGYHPVGAQEPLINLAEGLQDLINGNSNHPYALIGLEKLAEALTALQALCQTSGYPLLGSLDKNWLLPSAAGAIRPTCLAPETMIAGDLRSSEAMLIVGFEGYHDFFPHFAAANLEAQGFEAQAIVIDLPSLRSRQRLDTITLARLFDQDDFRAEVAEVIKPHLGDAARVGLPAVLGLRNSLGAQRDIESRLGRRIFEMPGLPPSVPGMRLHNLLVNTIQKAGGRVENGMEVVAFSGERGAGSGRIEAVWTESAARRTPHSAQEFILATGGFLGGGIKTHHLGYAQETIFDLPLTNPLPRSDWFQDSFLNSEGQPLFQSGVRFDADFRAEYNNLYVIGCNLPGDFVRERSLEGVALGSGYVVGSTK